MPRSPASASSRPQKHVPALTGVGELSYGRTNSRVPCDFSIPFIHTPGRANTQRPLVRVNAYFRRSFCRAASSVLRALPRHANSRGSSTSGAGTGHLAATSTDDSRKAIFPHKPAPTTYTWGSVLCQHSNHTPYLTGTHALPIATSCCSVPCSVTGPQLVVVSIGSQNTKERTSPLLIEGIHL